MRQTELMTEAGARGWCVFPDLSEEVSQGKDLYRNMALLPEQTHSLNVGIAEARGDIFPDTDALVTFQPELPIGVVTADCVPILIYCPDVKGIAAIHAGWRGTYGGIVENTVEVLERHGASLGEMKVAFGPSISMEKYEVDEELADKFRVAGFADYVDYPCGTGTKPHIDLQGVNIERLLRLGITRENITPNPDCTFSTLGPTGQPLYQSHRRSHGSPGRNLTFIQITE